MEAGAAALPQAPAAAQQQAVQQQVAQQQAAQLGSSLSHDYLASLPAAAAAAQQAAQQQHHQQQGGGQYGGGGGGMGMRNVGSSPALLYGSTHGSSNQLDYLLASGGLQQMQQHQQQQHHQQQQQHQQQQGGGGGGFDPTAQLLSGLAAADPMAGMNRSFSEMSLDSASAAGLGNRFATSSMSTGDLLAMTQSLQQGGGGPGAGGLRGIASTGSIWPHQHHHHGSLGSSPVGGGVWPGALSAGGSHGSLQDLLQKQAAMSAALQQQAAVNAALLQQQQQQPNPLVQNAALQAAMQQALLTQQAAALLGHGGLGAAGLLGGVGRRGAEAPLGGRLARRPMDPMAEAERRMQQVRLQGCLLAGGCWWGWMGVWWMPQGGGHFRLPPLTRELAACITCPFCSSPLHCPRLHRLYCLQEKLYSLDLNKIRAGDDKRTTLMVKNIPNKYTQKMLLAVSLAESRSC
jgi:hypothetical protein